MSAVLLTIRILITLWCQFHVLFIINFEITDYAISKVNKII